ncbi:UPF0146 family protein [Thermococcus gorgonarius]|uniref:UPF0146 protein A3K92_06260 n=1 Tax=Thermococcus gorgonarius TaxID=71997 RepID=A0A2Z2M9H2_THEGO|nr:UPF0146 family protein [Thermococcus gorgonarius]ASJ01112.1 hypothetical protein A3K92_06260 [Thermococcus gorgonarius]
MPLKDFADFIASRVPGGKVVEIGIGFQFKVALRLKELGFDVLAVDWNEKSVEAARKAGINAFRDDVFNPELGLYKGAKAVYSVRPTPEIVGAILDLGNVLGVPVFILPLSGDTMPKGMKLVNFRGLAIYVKNI